MTSHFGPDGHQAPDPYAAYRHHLATCPHRHVGILADCPAGARLRRAESGGPGDHEPARLHVRGRTGAPAPAAGAERARHRLPARVLMPHGNAP
ncbi:hypothetical protein RB200_08550 [Streptomyces sp. PmtG]